ncbi:MAG TPA: MaoC/PaaZ C-terminal domain-containing protein, partial [Gammaproteobacteria bacterium]
YAGMIFAGGGGTPEAPVPQVVYRQRGVHARLEDVVAYRHVCGEGPPDRMPPVYPHVLATPLQLNLLDSDDFPMSLAGLVHVGQAVEWRRPLHVDDVLDIECVMSGPEDSDHGWMFRLDTRITRGGECAWREEIRFLKPDPSRRVRPRRRSREGDASHFVPLLHMQFPEDTGRRYAKVSGDWNPIHLWPFTAKRFGFKRPIAHGMFSLARCLAVLEARGVDLAGKRLDAHFRAPVMLPAFSNFCLSDRRPDEVFALTDARKGRILVEGRLSELQKEK